MSKIVITGAGGMLAYDLAISLKNHDLTLATRTDLDITDLDSVTDFLSGYDYVINSAAYTNVDAAETDEENAYVVNALGAKNLAQAIKNTETKLVHISTDYVFAGNSVKPYLEDTAHNPVSAYGRTKAAGEKYVLEIAPESSYIIRTAWLYGKNGNNFAQTMLNLSKTNDKIKVVADQKGQPTWTHDLALMVKQLIENEAECGIYHGTNSGEATWLDFAKETFNNAGLDPARIEPTDSASFVRPAPRPSYSVLSHEAWHKAGLTAPRNWKEALSEAFESGVFQIP